MKSIIVLLSFVGIVALVIGYVNQLQTCPPPRVEYRYIPRTFEDEQNDPVRISKLFNNMFEKPSPWLAGYRMGYIKPNIYNLNKYNISQS